jgi:hypothetical protein
MLWPQVSRMDDWMRHSLTSPFALYLLTESGPQFQAMSRIGANVVACCAVVFSLAVLLLAASRLAAS